MFKDWLTKKLILVTGKGGVGKTTVSAALALKACKLGKKVLLVETHAMTQLGATFGKPDVGYHITSIKPNLDIMQLNAQDAFEEYVIRQIKFRALYKTIFENRLVKNFMEGTPGLAELLIIGKIWDLVDTNKQYDMIIVDAPATGHLLAMLSVPKTVATAIRIGPLKTKADSILKLITNPELCSCVLVSLAEELPTAESIELADELKNRNISVSGLVINQAWPQFFSEAEILQMKKNRQPELIHYHLKRFALSKNFIHELNDHFGVNNTCLFQLKPNLDVTDLITELADEMA